jgi:ribonuclease Y
VLFFIEGRLSQDENPLVAIFEVLYGTILVQAADAISAARPGVRGETLESYIRRLSDLEEIGSSFEGVDRCFAIQAGREIRVMVIPEEVDDRLTPLLARQVADKIEQQLDYPGQIKVTVIREVRAHEIAS